MHEIGIASSILESVYAEARRRPGARITAVGIRVGELSNIDSDALTFAFEALTRDSPWQDLKVEIEWCPRRQKCLTCNEEFPVQDYQLVCPKCGDAATTCVSGTELDIAYLDVEDICVKQ